MKIIGLFLATLFLVPLALLGIRIAIKYLRGVWNEMNSLIEEIEHEHERCELKEVNQKA